ncbi:hypothetical protein CUZ56_00727 [Saezia sanguinis]|jgi:uncharacterized membrane protein YhiD involved in acid resistance|uniref:Uncharacterized protein n=1 Tax=Saezia sanguinis TaxID=1965230 RepID=A0A433SHT6_9BURK|nr:hypothetical protein CUZ56_00727 [Saezia sanguinis]
MSFTNEHDYISLLLLVLSCALLLFGYSIRSKGVGPWVMLVGICSALAIIAFNILRHTRVFEI